MKTVVITQPTYLPWLGYFCLMREADVFVFLDNVQFERRSWQCRNRIKSPKRSLWLTVPTKHNGPHLIKDVKIDNLKPWRRKHWKALNTCYGNSPYFSLYSSFFEEVYRKKWTKLASLNIHIIKYVASKLGLSPVFLRASKLKAEGKRTGLLLNICKTLNADRYLTSPKAEEYMEEDGAFKLFRDEGVLLEFLEYKHPTYPQMFGEFVPHLSIVDCLFNCGPKSPEVVFGKPARVNVCNRAIASTLC